MKLRRYADMAKGSSNVFFDKSNRLTVMQLPTPIINVHFTTIPWTTANGPLRIIPGTHRNDGEMPSLRDEPAWMKKGCCLCPLPAGTAIVRDVRTWHGGMSHTHGQCQCCSSRPRCTFWMRFHHDLHPKILLLRHSKRQRYSPSNALDQLLCALVQRSVSQVHATGSLL